MLCTLPTLHRPPKQTARGLSVAPRASVSSLLLQELAGIAVHWGPQQRLLAHRLLLQLLPLAADGLKEQQAAVLLSAAWHAAALDSNGPAAYVALDCMLRAALGAAPAASLPQAAKMLAALQQELLQACSSGPAGPGPDGSTAAPAAADRGRLAGLSAAQSCALLCVCKSVVHALAAQLGQQSLERLAVPGCNAVLQSLAVEPPQGLLLRGLGATGEPCESGAKKQQFWADGAPALAFGAEEEQLAAAFLARWQQGTTAASQQAALAGALEAVPLFKQQGAAAGPAFHPIPLRSLMPRVMQQVRPRLFSGQAVRLDVWRQTSRLSAWNCIFAVQAAYLPSFPHAAACSP